jgi:PAS domain S-box-containing protein
LLKINGNGMVFNTAISFFLLASGIIFACQNREIIAVFSGPELGRIATGSLFSISIIILPIFNWLPIADNDCNFHEGKLAIPFLGAANIFFLAVAVLRKAQNVGDVANDRQLIENSLQQTNSILRSVIESTPDVIFVKDIQGRYAMVNSAAAEWLQISIDQTIGKDDRELFPPEIAQQIMDADRRIVTSGKYLNYEEIVPKNGEKRTLLTTKCPWKDSQGNIIGVINISRNISHLKQAETAMRRSEERLQLALWASDSGIWDWNLVTNEIYFSPEYSALLGYEPEELEPSAIGLSKLIYPDDMPLLTEELNAYFANPDSSYIVEYRMLAKSGEFKWLLARGKAVERDENNVPVRIIGTLSDISDRKIAEQALAEQLKISVFTADVGMALTENQTLAVTLRKCCDAVVRHFDAAFARIWTLNVDENVLELQASAGMYVHINGEHGRVAVGEFKIGLIAKERKPHLTNAVLKDPRVSDKEWAKREGMAAFAGYPLIVDNQLVGVIAMFSRQELNESTLIALGSIADSIALGIKRKQIEEALATQQQTLRSIIDNAPIWVWMTNPSGRMLLVNKTFCEDVAIPEARFLISSHYADVLGVEASANCMASDVKAWSQDTPSYDEEVLQFADGKKHYLETIKTQVKDSYGNSIGLVGLGLDVTQQKEAQRKLQDSEARFRKLAKQEALLNQLASNIRQSLDFDTILATTVQQIRDLLQLDRCLFIWYFPDPSPIWNVTSEAKNADLPSLLGIYPIDKTASIAERISKLEIISIDDVETLTDPAEREAFRSLGFNSLLDIPIQTPSGQIGAILCGACSGVRLWRDEEVELLMAVGNQLVIALNQAELYEKSRLATAEAKAAVMQQQLLNQLASQIRASLDLDTILATTVHQIRELLQVDRCLFIWYLPDASPPAWDVVYEAKNDELLSLLGYFPADITGALPQKIANLEIYQIDDVTTFSDPVEREFFLQAGYKSVLDLPIKSAGGLTGVVACISCREVRRWTRDEVELIGAIGDQLAIAISQSELYTQSVDSARIAQEQTKQLEVALCELQQTQTQLIQAEKMSSLGQMVAGIAHEINNPVSFIFGNLTYTEEYTASIMKLLQIYREEFPEPPQTIRDEIDALELDFILDDLPKMLSSMKVGATRIRDIVRSLRNFSRLDESDMKNVNIHEGIDSTLMILEHRLNSQAVSVGGTEYHRPAIQVVKEYGQLPLVECYAGQLNQVFMNIIANAIDVLEDHVQTPGIIRIRTRVEDKFVAIAIADNGAGIIDRVLQRIFDPFFTTKPIGSGTGMGLAISHSIIVEKHKGDIKCISAVGKGTEFTIKIPIVSH